MSLKPNLSILSITLGSGGAEKVISLLLKELVKDFNVTLILFHNQLHFPIPKEVSLVSFTDSTTKKPFYVKVFNAIIFLVKYNNILKKRKIKYAVSFLAFPNLINGMISIFNKNLITIISERGFPTDNTTSKLSYKISKTFYPILYNRCSKLFSNSVHINNDLKVNFGIKIPMEVIYNPIEIPSKTVIPGSMNYKNTFLKVITVGTLNTRKNQIMIVKAIISSSIKHQLTILGDGHLKNFLQSEIVKNNLNKQIYLKGNVKNVNEFLIKSDCFVLSSFTEGFPNALLEAMAVGLPCISTNCLSGPLELLNDNVEILIKNGDFFLGSHGILMNNDDDIALKRALEFLNDNPKVREKYSQLSLDRAKKYHLNSIYKQFKNFLTN